VAGCTSDEGIYGALLHKLSDWADCHMHEAPSPERPVGVAFRGGLDSTVLLHLCVSVWPGAVRAFHVHHGLQAAADDFLSHCQRVVQELAIPLDVQYVQVNARSGDSLEEQARLSRYGALAHMARSTGASMVLLAQHANDQAETLLLALTRGAGVAGLASMGAVMSRQGTRYGRPLLDAPQDAIRQCAHERGWSFIDDPSNSDERFTRNRLRQKLMPVLTAAFPQALPSLARSARHCAEAQSLLTDLAQQDLAATGLPPELSALRALSRARQGNALRHWLKLASGRAPSTAQLDELLDQVQACRTRGHAIRIRVADGWVMRDGLLLRFSAEPGVTDPK
jgi:tRNA(Ile)-lysidine synthase